MTEQFRKYAEYYDLVYKDKDYAGEASFVSRLLRRYIPRPAASTRILDVACGTGRHAQELAGMGYLVEGTDISTEMVSVARSRSARLGLSIRFHNESFEHCNRIGTRHDAVIAMFSAINYLTDYRDLSRALANIRELLEEGGIFLFDFWNGNAVLGDYSPVRVKRAEEDGHGVIRISNTTLDRLSQIATIKFEFILFNERKVVGEFSEIHKVRYFFPQEMADLLAANQFEVIHRCPFLREEDAIGPNDWNLTYVARPC